MQYIATIPRTANREVGWFYSLGFTKMSDRDIETVFMTLNLEFTDLKEKINSLTKKYDDLEKEVKQQRVNKLQVQGKV